MSVIVQPTKSAANTRPATIVATAVRAASSVSRRIVGRVARRAAIGSPAQAITEDGWDDHTLYRRNAPSGTTAMEVVAVPYATWDNREPGEMRVWFRTA